jgi:hypothetical protein
MHLSYSTLVIAATAAASLYLLLQSGGERKYGTVAFLVSMVELLLALGIITFSIVKFRVDVIFAVVLAVAGCLAWTRTSSKGGVTAATMVTLIGVMQLLLALRLF